VKKFSKILTQINDRFFKDFYDLTMDQLNELDKLCKPYNILWLQLFYETESVQKYKFKLIAEDFKLREKDLWEYNLMWSPSINRDTTAKTIQTVCNNIEIMNILKQSKFFRVP
jgi:hypothetical protein